MQDWAFENFGEEINRELAEHFASRGIGTAQQPVLDGDLSVALGWLMIDRELDDGGATVAQRFAARSELREREQSIAYRIAESRLGLYRVTGVIPGVGIELENVLDGTRTSVASQNVSQETVRWHVLLARVMRGGPVPTLWGAVAIYAPEEERELVDELSRIARARDLSQGPEGMSAVLSRGARELVAFIPPSRNATRVPYTLEGDVVAIAEATWSVRDRDRLLEALEATPELMRSGETDEGAMVFTWLTDRRALLARRGPLPAGALCIESDRLWLDERGTAVLSDQTSLGTFSVSIERLEFSSISMARLDAALCLVRDRFGSFVGSPSTVVRSWSEACEQHPTCANSSARSSARPPRQTDAEPVLGDAELRALYLRRWIDDPNSRLGGLSPREAALREEYRSELESLVRNLEHANARAQRDGRPEPKISWMRAALGLGADRVIA